MEEKKSMTRRAAILAATGGTAVAQTATNSREAIKWGKVESARPKYFVDGRELMWFSGPALNNQCPVCGTMAEPYRPRPGRFCGDSQVFDVESGRSYNGCDPALLPKSNHIICQRCTAVFGQLAEEPKP